MSLSTRIFVGPDDAPIVAMLDHDDEQRPILALVAWPRGGRKIEVAWSFGDATHADGYPVEFWLETMLRLLTPELAAEIIASARAAMQEAHACPP